MTVGGRPTVWHQSNGFRKPPGTQRTASCSAGRAGFRWTVVRRLLGRLGATVIIRRLRVPSLGLLAFLAGCSTIPMAGPASHDVRAGQEDPVSLPYALVRLTPKVLHVLAANAPSFSAAFKDRRGPTELRFGIGDIVTVTIFEAAAGGLFIPAEAGVRPGNFITLPPQEVDSRGNISVPYAGPVRAAGHTPTQVQDAIVEILKKRAIEPQVVVSFTDQRASSISVLGDVVGGIRYPATASGERVLDAITRAGLHAPGFETWVMLERNGKREIVPFGALVYEPANNVYVRPHDTIFLYKEPQTFLAFGASGRQGQIPFEAWRISLAEAAAKAGGVVDTQGDPASIFLYRGETRQVLQQLGIDCSKFLGPVIPVIYEINLRDPAGYFLASQFEMRNKDVIYIANAQSVDVSKFLNYLRLIIATANDPVNSYLTVVTLKNAMNGGAAAIVNAPLPLAPAAGP